MFSVWFVDPINGFPTGGAMLSNTSVQIRPMGRNTELTVPNLRAWRAENDLIVMFDQLYAAGQSYFLIVSDTIQQQYSAPLSNSSQSVMAIYEQQQWSRLSSLFYLETTGAKNIYDPTSYESFSAKDVSGSMATAVLHVINFYKNPPSTLLLNIAAQDSSSGMWTLYCPTFVPPSSQGLFLNSLLNNITQIVNVPQIQFIQDWPNSAIATAVIFILATVTLFLTSIVFWIRLKWNQRQLRRALARVESLSKDPLSHNPNEVYGSPASDNGQADTLDTSVALEDHPFNGGATHEEHQQLT